MISKSLRPHFAIALTLATIVAGAACRRDAVALTKHFIEEGDRYSAQQRYREAVVEYRNALEHAPRQGDIRVKLAEAYLKVGDAPAALKEYVHVRASRAISRARASMSTSPRSSTRRDRRVAPRGS